MNIQDLIETSQKYHGGFPRDQKIQRTYFDKETEYKCAVGCLLENLEALAKFCKKHGIYLIGSILTNGLLQEYGFQEFNELLFGELLRKSPEAGSLRTGVKDMQRLHDAAETVGEYLEMLEQYAESLKTQDVSSGTAPSDSTQP